MRETLGLVLIGALALGCGGWSWKRVVKDPVNGDLIACRGSQFDCYKAAGRACPQGFTGPETYKGGSLFRCKPTAPPPKTANQVN